MIKYLILAILIVSCVNLPYVRPKPRDYLSQEASAVVVRTECREADPFRGDITDMTRPSNPDIVWERGKTGSGVIIDERHVLTAKHVVEPCPIIPSVTVTLSTDDVFRMEVVKVWEDDDLALLELSSAGNFGLGVPPPTIASTYIDDGLCMSKAWPRREWGCGTVMKMHNGIVIFGAETSKPGTSGSAVYNSKGDLVGIYFGTIKCPNGTFECGEAATLVIGKELH